MPLAPPPARLRSDSDVEFEARLAEESRRARPVIEQALRESGLDEEAPPLGRLRSDSDPEFEAVPPLEAGRAEGPDGGSRSLGEILNNPRDLEDFLRFCKDEYSDENPLFWKAVEDWKNMPEGNFFRRWQKKRAARRIVRRFVSPASPKEVNLADANRRPLLAARNLAELSTGLRAAQDEILQLMESDTWKRFQNQG